jgi:hypothetical protein
LAKGMMSKNAKNVSLSATLWQGISPATIRLKMDAISG